MYVVVPAPSPFIRFRYLGQQQQQQPGPAPGAPLPADLVEMLRREGPIVDVQISLPRALAARSQQQGQPPGAGQTVRGLVDTGASISTVSDQVAAAVGLQAIASVPLGGVGGTSERPIFAAAVALPRYGISVDPIEIAGVTIPMPGIDVLIGRDVLRALYLEYKGPEGAFALTQKTGAPGAPAAGALALPSWTTLAIAGGILAAGVGALVAFDVV
jgi:hypothetical protein